MKKLKSIKFLFLLLFFYSSFYPQNNVTDPINETELNFKKIYIEIDGEEVFDVYKITQTVSVY